MSDLSLTDPPPGLTTPETPSQAAGGPVQTSEALCVDLVHRVPRPRGYFDRAEDIENQGLRPVHCPACQWPGIVVKADDRGQLINHHGRMFPCRNPWS